MLYGVLCVLCVFVTCGIISAYIRSLSKRVETCTTTYLIYPRAILALAQDFDVVNVGKWGHAILFGPNDTGNMSSMTIKIVVNFIHVVRHIFGCCSAKVSGTTPE